MITITINNSIEGVWKDFMFRGQPIKIKVRPRTSAKVQAIRDANCKTQMILNTKSNVMEHVEIYDEKKIRREVYDWVIEDIKGITLKDPDGKTLKLDESLKMTILNSSSESDNLITKLLDQANALAVAVEEGKEQETKNLDASLA